MNITEIIAQLEELKKKHGDLECGVCDEYGGIFPISRVEFSEKPETGMEDIPHVIIIE